MQEKGVVAEGDEESQVLLGLYLNSQPEEQEQETRRKRAVRANNRDRESGLKKFSNVRIDMNFLPYAEKVIYTPLIKLECVTMVTKLSQKRYNAYSYSTCRKPNRTPKINVVGKISKGNRLVPD